MATSPALSQSRCWIRNWIRFSSFSDLCIVHLGTECSPTRFDAVDFLLLNYSFVAHLPEEPPCEQKPVTR
jgi:hypothetical protein